MIVYKDDILALLSDAGYTQYRLRKENLLPESVMIRLRNNEPITFTSLGKICSLLKCQPGDLIESIQDEGQDD